MEDREKIRAVVFVIAIAVGGLLTTKGWNEWGGYSQKKTLLTSLAREWLVNEILQHNKPLSFDPNDPDLGEEFYMSWNFENFASDSILTSSLFSLRDKDDLTLCFESMFYEITATSWNKWFTFLDDELTRKVTSKERTKEIYQQMVGSPVYKQFKEHHEKIRTLLVNKYNWALEEAMLLLDEKTQKALKEKSKWPIEEVLKNKHSQ
jgi:hypothetical protein